MKNTEITLKDIYYNKLNNPYCDICNNRLNWSMSCNRGFDCIIRYKDLSNLEDFYCYRCKVNYANVFEDSNKEYIYALKFYYHNNEIFIINDLYNIFISGNHIYKYIIEQNTSVDIKLSIKYPYLNKETIKYLENLIFA